MKTCLDSKEKRNKAMWDCLNIFRYTAEGGCIAAESSVALFWVYSCFPASIPMSSGLITAVGLGAPSGAALGLGYGCYKLCKEDNTGEGQELHSINRSDYNEIPNGSPDACCSWLLPCFGMHLGNSNNASSSQNFTPSERLAYNK